MPAVVPVCAGVPPESPELLRLTPDLRITAAGPVPAGDELLLVAYARPTAEGAWAVSEASLLAALDAGRDLTELTGFLERRTGDGLPRPMRALVDDVAGRAGQLRDTGEGRVVECDHPALASFLDQHPALAGLCRRIGDQHLLVPAEHDTTFRSALMSLAYVLPR